MSLWSKYGGYPQELPFLGSDGRGNLYTDLPNNPVGREACGWVEVPDRPNAPEGRAVAWKKGRWVFVDAPTPEPPAIPIIVSRRQLRRQLLLEPRTDGQTGTLLDQMDAAVEAYAQTGILAALQLREDWNTLTELHRDHPELIAFTASQGIDQDRLADVWLKASRIS